MGRQNRPIHAEVLVQQDPAFVIAIVVVFVVAFVCHPVPTEVKSNEGSRFVCCFCIIFFVFGPEIACQAAKPFDNPRQKSINLAGSTTCPPKNKSAKTEI